MNVPAECRGRLGKSQGWDWTGVGKPSERGGGHVTYDVEDLEAVGLVVEEPVLQVGASFSQAYLQAGKNQPFLFSCTGSFCFISVAHWN